MWRSSAKVLGNKHQTPVSQMPAGANGRRQVGWSRARAWWHGCWWMRATVGLGPDVGLKMPAASCALPAHLAEDPDPRRAASSSRRSRASRRGDVRRGPGRVLRWCAWSRPWHFRHSSRSSRIPHSLPRSISSPLAHRRARPSAPDARWSGGCEDDSPTAHGERRTRQACLAAPSAAPSVA